MDHWNNKFREQTRWQNATF